MIFPKTTTRDYKNLCSSNVLSIEKNHNKRYSVAYEEFQKQLGRNSERLYELNLT